MNKIDFRICEGSWIFYPESGQVWHYCQKPPTRPRYYDKNIGGIVTSAEMRRDKLDTAFCISKERFLQEIKGRKALCSACKEEPTDKFIVTVALVD